MAYAAGLLALLVVAPPVYAQSRSQLFASAGGMAIGDDAGAFTLSAGGETVGSRGLSAGAEVAMRFGRTGFRPAFPNGQPYRQYLLSGLVGAHARNATGLAPFVNGGVSMITARDCYGPYFGWNAGRGTNYRLTGRLGVRADFRMMLAPSGQPVLALGRIGMVFR